LKHGSATTVVSPTRMTDAPPATGRDIVVSGSVSNIGPGFDALSVAVDVCLRVTLLEVAPAQAADSRAAGARMIFEGDVPATGENRLATAVEQAARHFGEPVPSFRAAVASAIPMKAGLGSSAAATIAGLRIYETLTRRRDPEALLQIASAIEGHPDNAAAALLGGLTLSCQCDDGRILTSVWTWPADLRIVVATPEAELETAFARKLLAPEISRTDAIFNLQRALLLVRALETGRYDHLREALRDRWHQPARERFVPGLREALALEHPAVLGACLSGAGPSVAVLAIDAAPAAAELRRIYDRLRLPCTIRTLSARPPIELGDAVAGPLPSQGLR
jgi:homoserine kinase